MLSGLWSQSQFNTCVTFEHSQHTYVRNRGTHLSWLEPVPLKGCWSTSRIYHVPGQSLYLESSWTNQAWLLPDPVTSLYRVWDFSWDACLLNSWNSSELLDCGLSDGLSECLGCSSVTLRCVPPLTYGDHWRVFCLGTSCNLPGKGVLILIQDLHFPLGRELDSILGVAFDTADYSFPWNTVFPWLWDTTLSRVFSSVSGHSFSVSCAGLSSSSHSLNTTDPQVAL